MHLGNGLVCARLLCICVGQLCSGAVFAQVTTPAVAPAGLYRVGPGDVLDITVFEVDELSKPATVGPRGNLVLPLLGEVEVEGLTPLEVAARIETLYGESLLRDPQISVSVSAYRSQPVSVFGAVERPGIYQLQGRRRLLEVLAMAGGLARDAGEEIRISRGSPAAARAGPAAARDELVRKTAPPVKALAHLPTAHSGAPPVSGPRPDTEPAAGAIEEAAEEMVVSVRGLLMDPSQAAGNPWINPYDVIRVAKAGLVYVLGAVERPGGYPIEREAMTVLRAVSLAQGLGPRAAPQKARVIRQQDGATRELAISIGDVLRGEAPDAPLEDNDILFVPDSRAKSALHRGAEAAIQLATGVIIWRR